MGTGIPPIRPRTKFKFGFSPTVERILELDAAGYRRRDMESDFDLRISQMSKSVRLYLTAQGKTPDSGHVEVKNKAIELVKKLDAEEISLHAADEALINVIRKVNGNGKTTYRKAITVTQPDQQLASYKRAVASLESICFAIDKMPEVIHSAIDKQQREALEARLAACRRLIERRINIFRKDENAEAHYQEG